MNAKKDWSKDWMVLCDFDHTVTLEDVTDTLLERFAEPEWHAIEAMWEQGLIGSRACMQSQIRLLRATPQQIDAAIDDIVIDPHFKAFADYCAAEELPLVIISDGLDYVISRVLARYGVHGLPIIASNLRHLEGDRWDLESPYANGGCSSQASTCKCSASQSLRHSIGAERMLYIGDGRSDYCVSASEADFILAKDKLLTYSRENHLPHLPFDDFSQAIVLTKTIITPAVYSGQQEAQYA